MSRFARYMLGAIIVSGLIVGQWVPAAAECTGQTNRWPSFEQIAPTAKRIVIGTVTSDNPEFPGGASVAFTLDIEEVLRGPEIATMNVDSLRSGVRLRGEDSCRRDATLRAAKGDRIVIAFDGKRPGRKGRVSSAVWLEGNPVSIINPGLKTTTMSDVRAAIGLPAALPTTSLFASLLSLLGSMDDALVTVEASVEGSSASTG